MAMINRLQVEKAAMHMEALQYLRMMEEQADHDQEEIGKLNDLLTEREKEMLDLEAELEGYESRLEETLGMPYTNRFDLGGTSDSLQSGSLRDHPTDWPGQSVENSELESRSSLLPQEHLEDLKDESVSLQRNDENQSAENQKYVGPCSRSDDDKISSMESIKQEILLLNSRFMALEADQKFLKQILSSLKCSSDAEQYVQEITSHLRELRRIATEQRDRTAL
uniref:GTD-binding domain-containing protein n=1 Tax=Aegilops tauschii subsp. strangulata TaxID=200361 RepID=A0A453IU04_AEGTS